MIDLPSLTSTVRAIAEEAATFISQERKTFAAEKIEHKGFHDVVSYVDKTSEQLIVKQLQPLIPEAGFITEEKTISQQRAPYEWVVDPLDGTANFMHNLPAYCVSIALTHHRKPILGVVYEVSKGECYYAYEGGGAYRNGTPIRVSTRNTLSESLLATGFPYHQFHYIDEYMNLFRHLVQQGRGIRRVGAAALDLAYVASGVFDAFFEYHINDYDMAAGILLVQEAGGQVFDFDGEDQMLDKGSVIAGNRYITPLVVEAVQNHFKK